MPLQRCKCKKKKTDSATSFWLVNDHDDQSPSHRNSFNINWTSWRLWIKDLYCGRMHLNSESRVYDEWIGFRNVVTELSLSYMLISHVCGLLSVCAQGLICHHTSEQGIWGLPTLQFRVIWDLEIIWDDLSRNTGPWLTRRTIPHPSFGVL